VCIHFLSEIFYENFQIFCCLKFCQNSMILLEYEIVTTSFFHLFPHSGSTGRCTILLRRTAIWWQTLVSHQQGLPTELWKVCRNKLNILWLIGIKIVALLNKLMMISCITLFSNMACIPTVLRTYPCNTGIQHGLLTCQNSQNFWQITNIKKNIVLFNNMSNYSKTAQLSTCAGQKSIINNV
jgi:hypothetical protein